MSDAMDYLENRQVFLENNRLYLTGQMNENITNNVIPKLPEIIEDLSTKKNPSFEIIINSDGGYDVEMLSLLYYLDKMKEKNIEIITRVIGHAGSNASLIACCGDKRYIARYGYHTIHFGTASRLVTTLLQSERFNESNKRKYNRILEIYEENTNLTRETIEEFLKDDYCEIDAEDCIKYGLADDVE